MQIPLVLLHSNNYFRQVESADGALAESTITIPNANNRNMVMHNVKSNGFWIPFVPFFPFFCTLLLPFFYIANTPIIHMINVIILNTDTTLFSFHPDNSK